MAGGGDACKKGGGHREGEKKPSTMAGCSTGCATRSTPSRNHERRPPTSSIKNRDDRRNWEVQPTRRPGPCEGEVQTTPHDHTPLNQTASPPDRGGSIRHGLAPWSFSQWAQESLAGYGPTLLPLSTNPIAKCFHALSLRRSGAPATPRFGCCELLVGFSASYRFCRLDRGRSTCICRGCDGELLKGIMRPPHQPRRSGIHRRD